MAVDSINDLQCMNELIDEVSKHIGKEWKRLARAMKFSKTDIDAIECDNAKNLKEQIYQMFHQWKLREGKHATSECLRDALHRAGLDLTHHEHIPIDQVMHLIPKPVPKHLIGQKHRQTKQNLLINVHYHFHPQNVMLSRRKPLEQRHLTKTLSTSMMNFDSPESSDLYVLVKPQLTGDSLVLQRQDSHSLVPPMTQLSQGDVYYTPSAESIDFSDRKPTKSVAGRRRLFMKAIGDVKKDAKLPRQPQHSETTKYRSRSCAQKVSFHFPKSFAAIITEGSIDLVKKETLTTIKFKRSNSRTENESILITGREENCKKALTLILTSVEASEQISHYSEKKSTTDLDSKTLESISNLSGAKIGRSQQHCKITGSSEQIVDARKLIDQALTGQDIESQATSDGILEKLKSRCKKIGFKFVS